MKNEALELVMKCLLERHLGAAIEAMGSYVAAYSNAIVADQLQAIGNDYQMMTDYWRKGFKDPQLKHLFDNLLRRLYQLYASQYISRMIGQSSFLSSLYMRVHLAGRDWTVGTVREELESIVSDIAMLDLDSSPRTEEKRLKLYERHHRLVSEFFDQLLTSDQWSDGQGAAMEELLLSPTLYSRDQQLLVSAVMLACVECFDMAKFRTMVHVYEQTSDEPVRQRALVGWVFAMNSAIALQLCHEVVELVEHLLENADCRQELVDLQKQMIYCLNAEQDHATIQQEIMPDLLQHNGFRMRNGMLEEVEDNPLDDILHPDAEERKLEKVEASFQRMVDMQRQGSDVYFGGFSQMKRFPFFNELCNWFMPFYVEHPGISAIYKDQNKNKYLGKMITDGPFCNSDKYSFMLAFSQVINRLPENIRQMLERGEATFHEVEEADTRTPAYIRRIYLQDLYRFYRVFPRREEFLNCFDTQRRNYLFFADPVYQRTHLEPHFNEITAFLLKHKRIDDMADLLNNYGEHRRDTQFSLMAAYAIRHGRKIRQADGGFLCEADCYARVLEHDPDNEQALANSARLAFRGKDFSGALTFYETLLTRHPDKQNYQLGKAVCLISLQRNDEALKILYRLNYEAEDDKAVSRVLAWALTCDGRYEQAERLYGQLLSREHPDAEDLLNYGYCLWFAGGIDEAADCFHRYLAESKQKATFILDNERDLIRSKGITEPEMQMMLNIL